MKKTFLNREKPALTCMVQAYTAERIKEIAQTDSFEQAFVRIVKGVTA